MVLGTVYTGSFAKKTAGSYAAPDREKISKLACLFSQDCFQSQAELFLFEVSEEEGQVIFT